MSNTGAGACPTAHTDLFLLHCTGLERGDGKPTVKAPEKLRSQGNTSFREHPQTLPHELSLCLPHGRLASDNDDLAFHSLSLYFPTVISFANFISSMKKIPEAKFCVTFLCIPQAT